MVKSAARSFWGDISVFWVNLGSSVGLGFVFYLVLTATTSTAEAQVSHDLIRRMAIFPVKAERADEASGKGLAQSVLDEAWWQIREEFTASRRFLVASKQFLVKTDAFQPRGTLEPADAIILGRLLDAHALVSLQLEDRGLSMHVYDGTTGLELWKKSLKLHPSLTVADQISRVARRLAAEFTATIPYQGFTSLDSLIGTVIYAEGESKLAQVDFGVGAGALVGDTVQWIRISGTNNVAPLFQGGGRITVFAEGRVIRIEQGVATVEVLRATSLSDIKEYTLVRVPREAERLLNEYAAKENIRTTLTAELVAPEMSPMEQIKRERRPLVTTLSFVSSLAAFLLLAF